MRALRSSRALAIGTGVRIVASPVVLALMLAHRWTVGGIVFAIAAATDFVDGKLARRWRMTTPLGAFLDTTADKLLVATALLGLVSGRRASPWLAFLIIGREFTILGLRTAVVAARAEFKTSWFGKWKATVQFITIALAAWRFDVQFGGAYLDQWLLGVAALLTVVSGVDYVVRSLPVLRS
jgi:CDP-diacylglycerol--glycerol-3-phosphate 3-phosphatidyltransferase